MQKRVDVHDEEVWTHFSNIRCQKAALENFSDGIEAIFLRGFANRSHVRIGQPLTICRIEMPGVLKHEYGNDL